MSIDINEFVIRSISIACWIIVFAPQLFENVNIPINYTDEIKELTPMQTVSTTKCAWAIQIICDTVAAWRCIQCSRRMAARSFTYNADFGDILYPSGSGSIGAMLCVRHRR